MNSREIVFKAIEFDGPERVPLYFPAIGKSDILDLPLVFSDPETGWLPFTDTPRAGRDEWGCYWTTMEKTMGQVTVHPLDDWKKIETYEFPDPHLERRFSSAKDMLKITKNEKYLMGSLPFVLFERLHFLRGFENLLTDLYLDRDKVLSLADKILQFQMEDVKQWAELGVDGIAFTDDWGSQKALFVPPRIFREVFKPRYKKLFDLTHKLGMHAYLHSDGKIQQIIPDFIDLRLDILNIPQPSSLFGIDYLRENFGGKICFCCVVDNQTTLVYGTEEKIRKESKDLVDKLGSFNGGLIAGLVDPCDVKALQVPQRNILVMCEAFKEFGRYSMTW